MKTIKNWLMTEPEKKMANNYIWNMLGSLSMALSTMVLTIAANRIMGDFAGGDFAMALAAGQLMATIGYFETRVYQVTDTQERYDFSDYYFSKIVTSIIMIISSIIYILIKGFTIEKSFLVFLLCVYKFMDVYADVFEGEFQLRERLDISGKSMTLRIVLSTVVLIVILYITRNLYISSLAAIIISIIIIYYANICIIPEFYSRKYTFKFNKIKNIIIDCFPLFISTFMSTYILNASRYAIEGIMPSNYHSSYTAIFLPVSVINLCVGFLFKPMLTDMARKWNYCYYEEFIKTIMMLLGGVLGVTLLVLFCGYYLGIPVLSFLYATDLNGYKLPFMILLIGGGLNSANVILYYTLSVMRKQRYVLFAYVLTFIFSLIVPNVLTQQYEVLGASFSFTLTMLVLGVILFLLVAIQFFKDIRR